MTQRQTHVTWGIIVVILVGIIAYMFYSSRGVDDSINLIEESNEQNAAVVEEETEMAPVEEEVVSTWKNYTNDEYKFEFQYPGDGKVGPFENNGVRIDNLPNYQMSDFPEGRYRIQFSIDEADEPCQQKMKSPEKFMIGALAAYRGPALDGPYSGYPFNMCVLKDGKNFSIFVADGYEDGTIANKIYDSFKFTGSIEEEEVSWKTYTNRGSMAWEIKYPENLVLTGNCMDDPTKCRDIGIIDGGQQVFTIDYDGALFGNQTLEQYAKERQKLNSGYGTETSAVKAVTYGSNKGYQYTVNKSYRFEEDEGSATSLKKKTKVVFFQTKTKNRVIRLMFVDGKSLYTDIAKTFKAIQ